MLNPLRTRRFAQAGLERTKTDAIDSLSIAKLAALKRPVPEKLTDELTRELREQVRLRDRLQQDLGDGVRELHRVVDLAFPEFTRHVKDLGSLTTTAVLSVFPTAKSLSITSARLVAELGDPARWKSAAALAAHVGVVPQIHRSRKHTPLRAGIVPLENRRLRHALWMPVLGAVRRDPWLRHHYQRLRGNGKLAKVALIACMRKLLAAIYNVAKHRRAFEPRLPVAASA